MKAKGRYPSEPSSCWVRSIDIGATVKLVVRGSASRWPSLPSMPSAPPGTEIDTVAPGGSGAVASKARTSGEVWTQDPATAGLRVGTGLSSDSGTVNCTLTASSDGTLVALGAGSLATTERRPGDAVGVAAAGDGLTGVAMRAVEAAASAHSATTTAAISQ